MILKSTTKLTSRFTINEVIDDMCYCTIIDLDSEEEIKNDDNTTYEYDAVEVYVVHNPKFIENHLDMIFAKGKAKENA